MPRPLRILIVKLTAIGDVIHAMPVACALRDHLPDATIAWVAEGKAGDLLRGHAALDELIVLPPRWNRSWRTFPEIARDLRGRRFDVALDLQGLRKSALAALLSGARRRIGFTGSPREEFDRWRGGDPYAHEMARQFSWWLSTERVRPTAEHVVDRYLELLRPLGIHSPRVRFDVPEFPGAEQVAEAFGRERSPGEAIAVINVGAARADKLWPADRFAEVARYVAASHALPVVVTWAGEAERRRAEQVVAGAGTAALLAPSTSLAELTALARRARIFLASDTGPLHLAAAVGTPCVGLFGPTPATRNGPYGPQHVAVQKTYAQGGEAMLAIDVASVCAACDEILGRKKRN